MTTQLTNCPNCGTAIKEGLLSSVKLLNENKTQVINEYHNPVVNGYCTKCGNTLYIKYKQQVVKERNELADKIQSIMNALPIVSVHTPLNWDYDILEIVTGQAITGSGVMTEFVSSLSDYFGGKGGRNKKLKDGENICFAQLRKQTLDLGGNAVIATNVDYSEVGDGKVMLMVCMSGTAIRLKNISVLGKEKEENIAQLNKFNDRILVLAKHNTDME